MAGEPGASRRWGSALSGSSTGLADTRDTESPGQGRAPGRLLEDNPGALRSGRDTLVGGPGSDHVELQGPRRSRRTSGQTTEPVFVQCAPNSDPNCGFVPGDRSAPG